MDICFGEDKDELIQAIEIFDRVKNDPVFANQVKSLRLHWGSAKDNLLDIMIRTLFRILCLCSQCRNGIHRYIQDIFACVQSIAKL